MKPAERKQAINLLAALANSAEYAFRKMNQGAAVVPFHSDLEKILESLKEIERGKADDQIPKYATF